MRRAATLAALLAAGCATAAALAAVPQPAPTRSDAYYSYCLARQAWFSQDYTAAQHYLEQAQAADPNASDLALDLGRLHLELDHVDEAARWAHRAVDLAPASSAAQRLLAEAEFMIAMRDNAGSEAIDRAARAFSRLLELDPNDAEALLSLAKVQIARGDLEAALGSLQRHLRLDPLSNEGVYLAAQALVKTNRFAEAERLLEGAVARSPENVQLGLALVEVFETRGDLGAAAEAARRLLDLGTDPIRVHFVLARLNQRMGKPADAFAEYREMARLMDAKPGDFNEGDRAEISLRMATSLLDAGRTEEAIAEADAGARRFTADPRFALRKAEALLVAGRPSDAESLLRAGLKAAGDDRAKRDTYTQLISDTYLAAAARQERASQYGDAESLLRKSIEWRPRNAAALNYLGYMLADRGERLDEAIGYIRRALDQEPKNGAYLDSLGWAYFKKRDYREAEKLLTEAISRMAEEGAIHDHLGDVYYATGRRDDALKAWRDALDRGAENADKIRAKVDAADGPARPRLPHR